MICPNCEFEQDDGSTECIKCGIIFEKFIARQRRRSEKEEPSDRSPDIPEEDTDEERTIPEAIKELFLYVPDSVNPLILGGRCLVFLFLLIWGIQFIFTPIASNKVAQSFMHLVNLPFHEAGHIIFLPFGKFLSTLGGSLGQLLMPFACFLVLLIKTRDTFGATVTLWWLGQSFMDLAPYINDARDLKLMLLGGVTGKDVIDYHDWEYLLRHMGWLPYDHTLARTAHAFGTLLMLVFFGLGAYLLLKQYRRMKEGAGVY